MSANYNCNSYLWEQYPAGTSVQLIDGHIYKEGDGYIARFTDDDHARRVLLAAGWILSHMGAPPWKWVKQ